MTHDDIKKLAHLARIQVTDEEVQTFSQDLEAILGYVAQIDAADTSAIEMDFLQSNVSRTDAEPIPSDTHTDTLLKGAPASYDGFYKVPKIL